MKRTKRIYALLGVLVVISMFTLFVSKREEKKEQIKNSDEIILEIQKDDVKSLSWKYNSETLAFHKDDTWLYDDDESFPVSEDKINELLALFEAFGASFTIEDVEDYGQYGLDNPICTIDLATEEKEYEILLGDYSKMDSERYVSIGDGNVYLVKEDPLDSFDQTLSDMIENDEIPSFEQVESVQFEGEQSYAITYEENSTATYDDDDVYFIKEDDKELPLDTERVESYLSTISSLSTADYVTYNATQKELKTYGLDDPELSVTVDYTAKNEDGEEAEDTFVLHISRDPKEKKSAKEDSEEEDITAYMRVGDSNIIYKLSGTDYETLMDCSYNDMRHLEVLWADFSDIEQIDLSLEGEDYTIKTKKKGDDIIYYYKDEEIEIDEMQSALTALEADEFTQEEPTQKEEISMVVHLDNENFKEVTIQLYRYDGSHCLAVVNGEPVSLVNRNLVVTFIEAVNAIVLD